MKWYRNDNGLLITLNLSEVRSVSLERVGPMHKGEGMLVLSFNDGTGQIYRGKYIELLGIYLDMRRDLS